VPGRGGRGPSGTPDDDDSQFSPGTIVGSLVTGGAGGLAGGPRTGQPWRLFEPLDVNAAAAAASMLATSAPASTSFFSSSHFRGSPEPSATHQLDRATADRFADRSDRAEHRLDRVERGLSPSGHTFGHGHAHPYQIRPRSRKQTRASGTRTGAGMASFWWMRTGTHGVLVTSFRGPISSAEQPRLDLDLDEEDRRLFGEAKVGLFLCIVVQPTAPQAHRRSPANIGPVTPAGLHPPARPAQRIGQPDGSQPARRRRGGDVGSEPAIVVAPEHAAGCRARRAVLW